MKQFLLYITFAVFLYAGVARAQSADINSLGWLAGCWENAGPSTISEEQWMKPLGGSMIGMSRTVKDGKTRWHEFLQIRQSGDSLVYIADPSGQNKTVFRAITITADEVVFENPEHDFPQRIIYHLNDDGSLDARIEGVQKGKERVEHFPYARVQCP